MNQTSTLFVNRLISMLVLATFVNVADAQILWQETFNGLSNGTTVDNGPTAWSVDLDEFCGGSISGSFAVHGNRFRGNETNCDALWKSEWIDVSAQTGGVRIFAQFSGTGGLDASGAGADTAKLGYRINGGSTITWFALLAGTEVNNAEICGGGTTADSIQIVLAFGNTDPGEFHYVDNITLEVGGGSIPTGSNTLFSRQDGDWDQTATWSSTVDGTSCSCTPDSNSIVYITCGHTVDMDVDAWAREVTVQSGAKLDFAANDVDLNISSNGSVFIGAGAQLWEQNNVNAHLRFRGGGSNELEVYDDIVGVEVDEIQINHAGTLTVKGFGRVEIEDDFEILANNVTFINQKLGTIYVANEFDVQGDDATIQNDSGKIYIDGFFNLDNPRMTLTNRDTLYVDEDFDGFNGDDGQLTNYGVVIINGDDFELSNNSDDFRVDNYGYFEIVDDLKESGTGAVACEFHNRNGGHLFLGHDDAEVDWQMWANYDSNTVEYNRSGNQLFMFTPQDAYWNLTLSTTGTKQALNDLDINGTLHISGTADFDVNTSNVDLTVAKNWKITSADAQPFQYGTELVTFDGAGRQWVNGAAGAEFYNIVLNKSADSLVLLSDMIVKTGANMTFTSGHVSSNNTDRLIFEDNATASSGSNASYVDGFIQKTGDDAFIFRTGDGSNYQPIAISAPAVTSDEFTARYNFADPRAFYDETALGTDIHHVSTEEYWILNRAVGTSSVFVTIGWNANSGGVNNLDSLVVARWNGSLWANEGNGATTGDASAGTISTVGAVANFSPFTLASIGYGFTGNALPIELLTFDVIRKDKIVDVSWGTASEVNNDFFAVQRSDDGRDWSTIGKVEGAKHSNKTLFYDFVDGSAPERDLYYRLKQVDVDGAYSFSQVRFVPFKKTNVASLSVYPNPVSNDGRLTIELPEGIDGAGSLQLRDITGRLIVDQRVRLNDRQPSVMIPISDDILPGHYIVSLTVNGESLYSKLIIQK